MTTMERRGFNQTPNNLLFHSCIQGESIVVNSRTSTCMQQTSLLAYSQLQPELGERQRLVLEALRKLKEANNLMVSKSLGLAINQITPRMLELRKLGLVVQSYTYPCPYTNKLTRFWRIK